MVPWYGYLMLFLLYITPFAFMTPIGLLSGLFTFQEMGIIFKNPIVNLMIAVVIIAGALMTYRLRSIIVKAELTPEGIKKFNKQLVLTDLLNIVIPVSSKLTKTLFVINFIILNIKNYWFYGKILFLTLLYIYLLHPLQLVYH